MTTPPATGTGFGGRIGFLNPIIGAGGGLVRNSIQSPNYVPGQSGWIIRKDGTAEFYGLTITGGGFIANQNGQFFYAGIPALGNLILAISGTSSPGIDTFGNVYTPGGMCLIGIPTASALFTLLDTSVPQNTLMSVGSDGSITTAGQVSADTDLNIAGQSFLNDIYPPLPQGLLARTNIFASSLPAPATPTTAEFYLYELDFTIPANGRSFVLMIEPIGFSLNQAGKLRTTVYATTDGSQPTNASAQIIAVDTVCGGVTANFTFRTAPIYHPFSSVAGTLWRFLVSINTVNTGAGTPTVQVQLVDQNPGQDSQVQARFEIYDMGTAVPNTGRSILATASGSGGGTSNYTKTYTCNGSHTYQGSDGGNSNLKINDNGTSYQGGNNANTYNGKAKTWYTFNLGPITADLAGATITKVQVYLNNNHSWYSGGMTAAIGWDNKTSFGSTAGDPAGAGVDLQESNFSEGQAKWVTVPNSLGTAFQNGSATTIVLFKNSNNLQFYGFFAGSGQGGPCQLRISYTK